MGLKQRAFGKRTRRKSAPPRSMAARIEAVTSPIGQPTAASEFGSGVIPPGTSRYQRYSAHLPSGIHRKARLRAEPDSAVDVRSDGVTVDLRRRT